MKNNQDDTIPIRPNLFKRINNKYINFTNLDYSIIKKTIPLFVLVFTLLVANKTPGLAAQNFISVTPYQIVGIVDSVSKYTPLLEENPDELKHSFEGYEQGYLKKEEIAETIISPYQHEIKEGETIASIAKEYGVNVATIIEANEIPVEGLSLVKPGETIIVPPESTTDSVAWLEELNEIKRREQEKIRKAEEEKAAKLAALNRRTVAYRESSISRASNNYQAATVGGFMVPISHKGISRGVGGGHQGIDYRADVGTPVVATKNGTIAETTGGWAGGFGVSVLVNHGGGTTARYAHLSRVAVSPGQSVSKGQVIGYSGNTGFSTGPHLHFEVRVNGRVINPF